MQNKEISIFDINSWEVNNYAEFLKSAYSVDEKFLLTIYTEEELKKFNVKTFKLKGHNLGFALKPDDIGLDIILFHNSDKSLSNSGVLRKVFQFAIFLGGNHFDYYETKKLKQFYKGIGTEYERYKFDYQYTHDNFNVEKYGTPDVVLVKI